MSMNRPSFFDSPFYDRKKHTLDKSAPKDIQEEFRRYKKSASGYVPTIEEVKKFHPSIAKTFVNDDALKEALKKGEIKILS